MLGVICGLKIEAELARNFAGDCVAVSSAIPSMARSKADELLERGVDRIISFGFVGALSPDLNIGDIVIGTQVMTNNKAFDCDGKWINTIIDAIAQSPIYCSGFTRRMVPQKEDKDRCSCCCAKQSEQGKDNFSGIVPNAARCGAIWGSDYIVAKAVDKRLIHEASNCIAVDMESHCVAEAAAIRGVPFAVARVVLDVASFNIPSAACVPLKNGGEVDLAGVVASVIKNPFQLPRLTKLGYDTAKAKRSLEALSKALASC